MSITWNPSSEDAFLKFEQAIVAAHEALTIANAQVRQLEADNTGATITSLVNAFTTEIWPTWGHFHEEVKGYLATAVASYNAAVEQDHSNAQRISGTGGF